MTVPIQASILEWRHLNQQSHTKIGIQSTNYPLSILEAMMPTLSIRSLSLHGVKSINDFMNGTKPKSVETMIVEYGLSKQHHFICTHIVRFLTNTPIPQLRIHPTVWNFYNLQKPVDRGISIFYNTLQNKRTFQKTIIKGPPLHGLYPPMA